MPIARIAPSTRCIVRRQRDLDLGIAEEPVLHAQLRDRGDRAFVQRLLEAVGGVAIGEIGDARRGCIAEREKIPEQARSRMHPDLVELLRWWFEIDAPAAGNVLLRHAGVVRLLVGVVARAHQRAARRVREAQRLRLALELANTSGCT